MGEQRNHQLALGAYGVYDVGRIHMGLDARLNSASGGQRDSSIEAWLGATTSYVWAQPWPVSLGLEAFVIQPLLGERVSDLTFGLGADFSTFYYGPSVSLHAGPLWTPLSAVTGVLVTDPASILEVRWWVGMAY